MVPYIRTGTLYLRIIVEVPDYIQELGKWSCYSHVTSDRAFYESFVEALEVLGRPNVELVLHALEGEQIIHDGKVDRDRLEPALRSIFGDGAKVFLAFVKNPKPSH